MKTIFMPRQYDKILKTREYFKNTNINVLFSLFTTIAGQYYSQSGLCCAFFLVQKKTCWVIMVVRNFR